jgi:hypothetical protein
VIASGTASILPGTVLRPPGPVPRAAGPGPAAGPLPWRLLSGPALPRAVTSPPGLAPGGEK